MSYPFRQWPTARQLAKELSGHDVQLFQEPGEVCFVRTVSGVELTAEIDPELVTSMRRLDPNIIRFICRRLEIEPNEVGMELG